MNLRVKKADVLPYFCIILYIIAFNIAGNGSTIAKITKVFFTAIIALRLIQGKHINYKYMAWLVLYELYVALSVSWAIQRQYAQESLLTVSYTILCALCMAINIGYKDKYIDYVIKIWMCVPLVHLLIVLATNGLGVLFNFREGVDGQVYNVIGQDALLGAALGFLIYKKYDKKWVYLIGINILIILVSGSRKSLLLLLMFYLVLYVVSSKNLKKILGRIVIAASVAVFSLLLIKNGVLGENIYQIYASLFESSMADESMAGRLSMITYSLEIFREAPWFGHGIGYLEWTCIYRLGQEMPIVDYDYLDILVDLGVVGLAVFYGFVLVCLIKYIKYYKMWKIQDRVFFAWLVVQLVYGTICRQYYNNYKIFIIMYLIWINLETIKIRKEENI